MPDGGDSEMSDALDVPIEELTREREPDFSRMLKVLNNERPDRPVLFEIGINVAAARGPLGDAWLSEDEPLGKQRNTMNAARVLGYDYACLPGGYELRTGGWGNTHPERRDDARTVSESTGVIRDEESFEAFEWPVHNEAEYARLAELAPYVPEGMKLLMRSYTLQERIIDLVGYENLCLMLYDNPALVGAIADRLGELALEHLRLGLQHDFIGFVLQCDDWGFKTQVLLPPDVMREHVIPWHKRIADTVHALRRPLILHSCGRIEVVMGDVVDVIGYDGKHSFEDEIIPIEDYYEKWQARIALLGGIDVDFLCRRTPREVFDRSRAMLERTADRGGYALGSGNSVPEYVPVENYLAMLKAALS